MKQFKCSMAKKIESLAKKQESISGKYLMDPVQFEKDIREMIDGEYEDILKGCDDKERQYYEMAWQIWDDCGYDYAGELYKKLQQQMYEYVSGSDYKMFGNFANIQWDWDDDHKDGIKFADLRKKLLDGVKDADTDEFSTWAIDWFFHAFGTYNMCYNFATDLGEEAATLEQEDEEERERENSDESKKKESLGKKNEKGTTHIETYVGFDELLGYADAEYLLEDVVDVLSTYYTYEDDTFDEDQAKDDPEFTIKIEGGDERADFYSEDIFYVHLPNKEAAEELAKVLGGNVSESKKKEAHSDIWDEGNELADQLRVRLDTDWSSIEDDHDIDIDQETKSDGKVIAVIYFDGNKVCSASGNDTDGWEMVPTRTRKGQQYDSLDSLLADIVDEFSFYGLGNENNESKKKRSEKRTVTIPAVSYDVFTFDELSDQAKETAKEKVRDSILQWRDDDSDVFTDSCGTTLNELFPNSDLNVQYSLSYCQGDGLNTSGKLKVDDLLDVDLTAYPLNGSGIKPLEDKEAIKAACEKADVTSIDLPENRRYCYSMADRIEVVPYYDVELTDEETALLSELEKFAQDVMGCINSQLEHDGYDWFYEVTDENIQEEISLRELEFTEDGELA